MIEELFTGSVYLTSDNEINIVAFPSHMSPFEQEFVRTNRVWGIRLKQNILEDFDQFIKIEDSLTQVGQELQFRLLERFLKKIANKFPDLTKMRLGSMLHEASYVTRFIWIRESLDKFLPAAINEELEKQTKLLLPGFLKPIISLAETCKTCESYETCETCETCET